MNDIYNKVVRVHNIRIPAHRCLPDGGYTRIWYGATIELTIDTQKLAEDMANCITNKSRKAIKAGGCIVARAHSIEEIKS